MASIFFIISMIAILLLFCTYIIHRSLTLQQLKNKIQTTEQAFKQLQETNQSLRQELMISQSKLNHMTKDSVTHLLGWPLFEDRVSQSIKESERYQLIMGILLVDIDDFKLINDALGYEVGNALLQAVGERLQSCIRQVDSVSRLTKDTFVVLLSQLTKPEAAALVAQRVLQSLAQSFDIKGRELSITASIGIAIYPLDGQETQALLRSGDYALHLAKEKGKRNYQFYQAKMHMHHQRELAFYNSLNCKEVPSEFSLYYQPIMDVQADKMIGVDTLLYWQHTEFGLMSSDLCLSLIEKQHKADKLFEWMLTMACKQFLHWQSLGDEMTLLCIPLSAKILENSHFIYRMQQVLQTLQFNPHYLLIRIKQGLTETSDALEKAFNMLNYLGVNIAVDDFGETSFSLKHLKNGTIRYMKLDPQLVANIQDNDNQQVLPLIKSLLFLAQSLNIQVIVQGVDTEKQGQILKALGVRLMQGAWLGKPLSQIEMASKMASSIQ